MRPDPHQSVLIDFATYGRYLVAAPMFVYAGSAVLPRLADVVRQFAESDLIRANDRAPFDALVASTRRLLSAPIVDATIVVLAYILSAARSQDLYHSGMATWVSPLAGGDGAHLSVAGWWRALVSQPLFNALLGIWLWRLLLWIRFTHRLTRMNLRLVAAHPDLLGGVRFTLLPLRGFAVLAFGVGAATAGSVAGSVVIDGEPLSAFRFVIAAQVVAVLVLFAGPSLLWMGPLRRLHESGTLRYGRLASRLGQAFQKRWLTGERDIGPEALDVQDFSATTDLFSIVANVRSLNLYVLDVGVITLLVGATLLPYLPLIFAVIPLDDILRFALKAFA